MVPKKDFDLAVWTRNFYQHIQLDPEAYTLSQQEVDQYEPLHLAFLEAYQAHRAAVEAGVMSRPLVRRKDDSKVALQKYARELYARVQAAGSVSDVLKLKLGLTLRGERRKAVPVPDAAPWVLVADVSGHFISLRIKDDSGARRGKAELVAGAILYSFVGDDPPSDTRLWRAHGNVTRSSVTVTMEPSLAPGTKVYFTARWYNNRGQSGPAAAPVRAHIGFDGAMPMEG